MKKISKLFLLIFLLIIPTFVKADYKPVYESNSVVAYNYYDDYDYNGYNYYSYNNYYDYEYDWIANFFMFYFIYIIIIIICNIYLIIVKWFLFKKAGRNGWEAIIPFYSTWVLFEISGYPGYYLFFAFLPCVGFLTITILKIIAYVSLSKKFEKSGAFALLLIFFPVIGFSILAFDKSKYNSNNGNIIQNNSTTNNSNYSESTILYCTNCGTKRETGDIYCTNCGNKL